MVAIADKRRIGAFYTTGNPFRHEPFRTWFSPIESDARFLEPFAGNGQIPRLMAEAGIAADWELFDIDTSISGVRHQDCLVNFPRGFDVVITNPPYLSYHFAKRKGLNPDKSYFQGYASLYQSAIARALEHCSYVAMIIPESFITSGLFRERLEAVVSLPYRMFDDTDMPTCLALWGPVASPTFAVWRGDDFLGTYAELSSGLPMTPCASRITFNVPSARLGLRAIDNTREPSIAFCAAEEIPVEKIKHSARLVSRIHVDSELATAQLMTHANSILTQWRERTQDVLLTAFKGHRADGAFRRRLDFDNARRILGLSLCELEGHDHQEPLALDLAIESLG